MYDFVETVGVGRVLSHYGYDPADNFESIYTNIHESGTTSLLDSLDEAIRSYFRQIELPDTPTLYDYLLISLRPKDIILSFNWDPLLPQAFRRWRHLGHALPTLAFLHGNVDIGLHRQRQHYGFLADYPDFEPTALLYPVGQKDYNTDLFIADQWKLATSFLAKSYYVTVFGYRAPLTDVEARSLLLNAWKNNPTHTLADCEIIDIRDAGEVGRSWSDFIVGAHGGVIEDMRRSILFAHPRGTCEAFGFATLQQQPWHEDRFVECATLSQLRDWVSPLINEEGSGRLAGNPHH